METSGLRPREGMEDAKARVQRRAGPRVGKVEFEGSSASLQEGFVHNIAPLVTLRAASPCAVKSLGLVEHGAAVLEHGREVFGPGTEPLKAPAFRLELHTAPTAGRIGALGLAQDVCFAEDGPDYSLLLLPGAATQAEEVPVVPVARSPRVGRFIIAVSAADAECLERPAPGGPIFRDFPGSVPADAAGRACGEAAATAAVAVLLLEASAALLHGARRDPGGLPGAAPGLGPGAAQGAASRRRPAGFGPALPAASGLLALARLGLLSARRPDVGGGAKAESSSREGAPRSWREPGQPPHVLARMHGLHMDAVQVARLDSESYFERRWDELTAVFFRPPSPPGAARKPRDGKEAMALPAIPAVGRVGTRAAGALQVSVPGWLPSLATPRGPAVDEGEPPWRGPEVSKAGATARAAERPGLEELAVEEVWRHCLRQVQPRVRAVSEGDELSSRQLGGNAKLPVLALGAAQQDHELGGSPQRARGELRRTPRHGGASHECSRTAAPIPLRLFVS